MGRQSIVAILLGVAIVAGACLYWLTGRRSDGLPAYIVQTNGRLEFDRVDVAVKYPGRIVGLSFREGDRVQRGQILAREDTAELQAQLVAARAQRMQALGSIMRARAELEASRAGAALARLEATQTEGLYGKELVSSVEVRRRRLALSSEMATVAAAAAAVVQARGALDDADAEISRLEAVVADTIVRAPVSGLIEYKIVENGAVLPAGGRVATLLDPTDVHMTIFVGTEVVGELRIGDAARIELDGFGVGPLPAIVSFISPEAQFTPKYVETASEREQLVYRVKLRIPTAVAAHYEGQLKAGATGSGYLRLRPGAQWPMRLEIRAESAPP